jgi:uncharacterized protein YjiS (DUF1127 family)
MMFLHCVPMRRLRGLRCVWREIRAAIARRYERDLLLRLDDRALKDFGISRCDAWHEASKGWRR